MVKAYLRYDFASAFGVVTSNANPEFDASGRNLISASLESISVWNIKQCSLLSTLQPSVPSTSTGSVAEATVMARAPHAGSLAVGYSDGTVRLWNLETSECTVSLKGHKSAVTALRFNGSGSLLASGSRDTDLIVWDVVGEAGLYRLRGHKDQITDLVFLNRGNRLISCSKDGLVKVWDLATQHCSQTVAGYKAEVWSLDLSPNEKRLITGSTDHELRMFAVHDGGDEPEADAAEGAAAAAGAGECLKPMGSVKRAAGGSGRVCRLRFDGSGTLLACQGTGKSLEIFRVRDEAEAKKKLRRRKKRRREKSQKKSTAAGPEGSDDEADNDETDEPRATDEIEAFQIVTCKSKLRSFAFAPPAAVKALKRPAAAAAASKGGAGAPQACLARIALSLANNTLELLDLLAPAPSAAAAAAAAAGAEPSAVQADTVVQEVAARVEQGGHRADIRAVALSLDDQLLLSTSNAAIKIWNPQTGVCLSTMESGYGLCCLFAPGNSHAVVGTKEGQLEVFDLGAAARVHIEEAHEGPVWSVAALPDRTGFVSGSADKTVKFWQWKLVVSAEGVKQLRLQHTRTLKMSDDVLCVRVSPDSRLLAVSLLDATIKVFYLDSLKFFLSLYGHKLPVLCMDISSDSSLLVSGSADKNIKVWGLDFGDCHKSMFAHADTVMQVSFVHNTHYCFTVGKDRLLKYWDVDRHEMLLELPGHHAEVWALAVSMYGDFVITGSHDRSLRRWERSQEPFFVEEEREKRLDSMFEADMERQEQAEDAVKDAEGAVAPAGRKTLDSVGAADSIIEALELAAQEVVRQQQAQGSNGAGPKVPPNPLMLGLSPSAYVLRLVTSVKSADLESALLMLPFSDALRLLTYLPAWLEPGAATSELACRVAVLLLRLHHGALVATAAARPALAQLQRRLRPGVQALKDMVGFNQAALRHLQRAARERSSVAMDTDALMLPAKRALQRG